MDNKKITKEVARDLTDALFEQHAKERKPINEEANVSFEAGRVAAENARELLKNAQNPAK